MWVFTDTYLALLTFLIVHQSGLQQQMRTQTTFFIHTKQYLDSHSSLLLYGDGTAPATLLLLQMPNANCRPLCCWRGCCNAIFILWKKGTMMLVCVKGSLPTFARFLSFADLSYGAGETWIKGTDVFFGSLLLNTWPITITLEKSSRQSSKEKDHQV